MQGVDGLVGGDPRSVSLRLLRLPPLLLDVRALAPSSIHGGDRPGACHQGARLRGAGRCSLERDPLGMQEGFDGLPQVFV